MVRVRLVWCFYRFFFFISCCEITLFRFIRDFVKGIWVLLGYFLGIGCYFKEGGKFLNEVLVF